MENIKVDAATINTLFDTLGAVVMALSATMQPEQKQAFADHLSGFAKSARAQHNTLLEAALLDVHAAARR